MKFSIIPSGSGPLPMPFLQIQLIVQHHTLLLGASKFMQAQPYQSLPREFLPFEKLLQSQFLVKQLKSIMALKHTVLNKTKKNNHIILCHPIIVRKGTFPYALINFLMQLPYGFSVVLEAHKPKICSDLKMFFASYGFKQWIKQTFLYTESFIDFWPLGGDIGSPLTSELYLHYTFITGRFDK